jgi:hypothetical protein
VAAEQLLDLRECPRGESMSASDEPTASDGTWALAAGRRASYSLSVAFTDSGDLAGALDGALPRTMSLAGKSLSTICDGLGVLAW